MKLSIVICTYNRAEILKYCFQSIIDQKSSMKEVEVLVVDNNSLDNTEMVVKEFVNKIGNLRYICEPIQGLSYARNRGHREAKGDWICYLDDDAKAHEDMVEKSLEIINGPGYLCFGGLYLPWYKYGKPRWFKDKYASNKKPFEQPTILTGNMFLSGGIFFVNRNLIIQLGGFSTDLGMAGNKVAYGEETELQLRIREANHPTVYIPQIRIDHLVPKYKLKVDWFLNGAQSLGRDQVKMGIVKRNYLSLLKQTIIMVGLTFIDATRYTPRLLGADYYIENWKIDVLRKANKRIGMIREILSKH